MKNLVYTLFLLFISLAADSQQFSLLQVAKGSTKGCTINGTYQPKGLFLKNFPNFLNDGKYSFDDKVVVLGKGLDYECFYGDYEKIYEFGHKQYPAQAFMAQSDLSDLGKIRVKLCGSPETGAKFHLDDKNYVRTVLDLKRPKEYELNASANIAYDKMDAFYRDEIANYLKQKKAEKVVFSALGSHLNSDTLISEDEITMQFEYLQSAIWLQKATADRFPSYSLYRLLIKNTDGDTLKTYGQAIFFDQEHSKFSRPKLTEHFVFTSTFVPAVQSLINQFINDGELRHKIKADNEAKLKKLGTNGYYAKLVALKNRYCALQDRKNMLNLILLDIGFKQDMLEAGIKGAQQGIAETTALNGSSGAGMLGGLITGLIMKSSEKKQLEKVNAISAYAKAELADIMDNEDQFVRQISASLVYPSDFFALIKNKYNATGQLKRILDDLLQNSSNIDYNMTATYRNLNATYLNGLASNMQSVLQSPVTAGNTGATTPINGGQASAAGNTDCSKKSEAEWKASQEYIKCNSQTVVNTSQASCERAKAKLIEITLKNCRSKLPPNEIKVLEQTRQQLLQRAAEMDRGAFRMN